MPIIEPKVSMDPPSFDLRNITAGSKTMIPVALNVSFPTEITLSPSVGPSNDGTVNANLYLEEKHTVFNVQTGHWHWSEPPTVTNEGSSALVQPAKNDYSYPLGQGMSQSQTYIEIEVTAPTKIGPFTKSVEVAYLNGFQRFEIAGEATGL